MAKSGKAVEPVGVPLRRRSLQLMPQTVDTAAGTVSMIVATETPAIQYIPDPTQVGDFDTRRYVKALEVLAMDGVDFSRAPGMPFCDSHNTTSIRDNLGSVLNLRIEGLQLVGEVKFRQAFADLLTDIADGHLQQVSVGYSVSEYEIVGTDPASGLPIVRATRWCPHEVSSVAVGADPGAVMRSQRSTSEILYPAPTFKRSAPKKRSQENPTMADAPDLETLVTNAEDAQAAAAAAISALSDVSDDGASDEVKARLAKLRAAGDETDPETDGTDTPDASTDADPAASADDQKEEDAVRSIAKKRGPDAVAFVESLRGLKRGKALRDALGNYIAARATSGFTVPALTPVVEKVAAQRSADLAKALNPAAIFAARKRGFKPGK